MNHNYRDLRLPPQLEEGILLRYEVVLLLRSHSGLELVLQCYAASNHIQNVTTFNFIQQRLRSKL